MVMLIGCFLRARGPLRFTSPSSHRNILHMCKRVDACLENFSNVQQGGKYKVRLTVRVSLLKKVYLCRFLHLGRLY